MQDWNVVATTGERRFALAREMLEDFGPVHGTSYHNVMVMRTEDTEGFLSGLVNLRYRNLGHFDFAISRIVPSRGVFDFGSVEEFESKAREIVLGWANQLEGKSFHVRLHRRGFKGTLSSQREEQFLDKAILERTEEAGLPASISFDDPDAILSVETIDNRAGMSLWSRDELRRYPFLRLD